MLDILCFLSLEKTDTSAPVVDPLEGYGGVPGVPAFPSEIFKSFTALPLIEEYLESDSPPPKETEMWSLVSFPNLAEEMEKVWYSITRKLFILVFWMVAD